jgi:hypothetical protein
VDAALLRRCCDELSDRVHRHGLRLRGAEVVGPLDLSGLDIGFPLLFEDCEFDSPLGIEGAQLFEVRAVWKRSGHRGLPPAPAVRCSGRGRATAINGLVRGGGLSPSRGPGGALPAPTAIVAVNNGPSLG